MLYPKLLAPAVMNAESDDYIVVRGMGLWLSLNFYMFNKLTKTPSATLANKDSLAAKWGEINLKYAKKPCSRKRQARSCWGFGPFLACCFKPGGSPSVFGPGGFKNNLST